MHKLRHSFRHTKPEQPWFGSSTGLHGLFLNYSEQGPSRTSCVDQVRFVETIYNFLSSSCQLVWHTLSSERLSPNICLFAHWYHHNCFISTNILIRRPSRYERLVNRSLGISDITFTVFYGRIFPPLLFHGLLLSLVFLSRTSIKHAVFQFHCLRVRVFYTSSLSLEVTEFLGTSDPEANVNDSSFIKLTLPQKYKVCTIFHFSFKIPNKYEHISHNGPGGVQFLVPKKKKIVWSSTVPLTT